LESVFIIRRRFSAREWRRNTINLRMIIGIFSRSLGRIERSWRRNWRSLRIKITWIIQRIFLWQWVIKGIIMKMKY